jgi:hypothetical protein
VIFRCVLISNKLVVHVRFNTWLKKTKETCIPA